MARQTPQAVQEPTSQPEKTESDGDKTQPQAAPENDAGDSGVVQEQGTGDQKEQSDNMLTGAVVGGGFGSLLWLWILLGLIILAGILVIVLRRKK